MPFIFYAATHRSLIRSVKKQFEAYGRLGSLFYLYCFFLSNFLSDAVCIMQVSCWWADVLVLLKCIAGSICNIYRSSMITYVSYKKLSRMMRTCFDVVISFIFNNRICYISNKCFCRQWSIQGCEEGLWRSVWRIAAWTRSACSWRGVSHQLYVSFNIHYY